MSEYRYYEFLAMDRPLDERQMAELRRVSTRADILADLQDLAERERDATTFARRLRALRTTHARKASFMARLEKAGVR